PSRARIYLIGPQERTAKLGKWRSRFRLFLRGLLGLGLVLRPTLRLRLGIGSGADELHLAGDDLELGSGLLGFRVDPPVLLQHAVDEDLAALLEELGADLGEPAPGRDLHEGHRLGFLTIALRVVVIGRDAEGTDGRAAADVPKFRIP